MVSRVVTHVSVRHVAHVAAVAPGAGAVSPVSDNVTVTPVSEATQVLVTLQRVTLVTVSHLGQEARPLILVQDGVTVERPRRGRRRGHDTCRQVWVDVTTVMICGVLESWCLYCDRMYAD